MDAAHASVFSKRKGVDAWKRRRFFRLLNFGKTWLIELKQETHHNEGALHSHIKEQVRKPEVAATSCAKKTRFSSDWGWNDRGLPCSKVMLLPSTRAPKRPASGPAIWSTSFNGVGFWEYITSMPHAWHPSLSTGEGWWLKVVATMRMELDGGLTDLEGKGFGSSWKPCPLKNKNLYIPKSEERWYWVSGPKEETDEQSQEPFCLQHIAKAFGLCGTPCWCQIHRPWGGGLEWTQWPHI